MSKPGADRRRAGSQLTGQRITRFGRLPARVGGGFDRPLTQVLPICTATKSFMQL